MNTYLDAAELSAALSLADLTDPAYGPHAMQLLVDEIVAALTTAWRVPARVVREPALVSVSDNYDRLGFNADDVTRDRRYSRYASPSVMLRSHTSAAMPRALAETTSADELLVVPGLVYRRDEIDRTHVGTPHQLDVWRLTHRPRLGEADLTAMIGILVEAVLPGATWRSVDHPHPYTVGGRQVDVLVDGRWLELAECGLIAPQVLTDAGHNPDYWSGLALGMGLDRALMLRKGIDDIRLLRSTDPRISSQLGDLAPYRPVSHQPPVRRDLSIVVDAAADAQTLGDAARTALGQRADDLEAMEVIARTPYDALPQAARDRLGLRPDQVNLLIRLTLRPLSSTLTDAEANELRDLVYRAVHTGPELELIT